MEHNYLVGEVRRCIEVENLNVCMNEFLNWIKFTVQVGGNISGLGTRRAMG